MQTNDLLEIRTLGHVVINWRNAAKPLAIPPREATLLIYLAYQRVKVSRTHLCHLFWPEESSQRAHGNLRKLLLDTRRNLASFIVVNLEEVGLHQDLKYWLDVHEFQWQMQPLEQKSQATGKSAIIETPRLQRGLQLYQGDFLGDLKPPKSRVFGAWVEQEQQRLHQQAIDALKLLAEESRTKGRYEEALGYTKRLSEFDPLDEEVQELHLRLLAQMGRSEEAIQHFQHYRSQLKKELALEPESHLVQLYQQIRAGATLALSPVKSPAVQVNGRGQLPLKQIPKPLTPLFGRAESLQQLQAYLMNPTVRLVTLTGMSGIGKTHLALALFEQQMIAAATQPIFVSLAATQRQGLAEEDKNSAAVQHRQTSAIQTLTLTLAQAIGFVPTTIDSLGRQLGAYLHDQSLLLVFDGFDPLVAGATFIVELLQEAPLCKVLVTARQALQLPGEVILPVEGLALPTAMDESLILTEWKNVSTKETADNLSSSLLSQKAPALHLFLHALQRQNPQIVLSVEDLQTILHICRLVEGNPLAITQAAALSLHYSWLEIAEQLAHCLTILQAAYRSDNPGQRSMMTVLEEGWGLLTQQEQAILGALTGFPDAFTRHDAVVQTSSSAEILIALVNKSWVRSKGAGLYELPRLVRLFVQGKG
jgi:DNA-binding SARP family transcriptional activator/predicted ATPase